VSFHADGTAPAKAVDGTWDNPKDYWQFNADHSFSELSYVEAMPEYGLDEPTYSEDRYHVLKNGEGEFVLFNGDGSLILIFSRAADQNK